MGFLNVYADDVRAKAYATLEFPGTYYLAYRDLPDILREHVRGTQAVDVGCGTGRSTRFLRDLGFQAVGVDIAEDMIALAREHDPWGMYHLVEDGNLTVLQGCACDLALLVFTCDNIPTREKKVRPFRELGGLLKEGGKIVNLVSSPDIYTHEWASFTTRDFPENRFAGSGDSVKIIMTDVEDPRPVEDVLWSDEDYRDVFNEAGLEVVTIYRPLARPDEPFDWVNETRIAPWVIYVLKKAAAR